MYVCVYVRMYVCFNEVAVFPDLTGNLFPEILDVQSSKPREL